MTDGSFSADRDEDGRGPAHADPAQADPAQAVDPSARAAAHGPDNGFGQAPSEEPNDVPAPRRRGLKRRIAKHSGLFLFEVIAGVLAILALGAGLLAWRLGQGPIPLALVESQIESQLTQARNGRKVDLDGVALMWAGPERGLQLTASRVQVFDASGALQTAADGVDIGIDLGSLALARLAVSGLQFRGGEVTLTLAADGGAALAFGPPGAPADLIIPAPADNKPILETVNWALDGMAQAMAPLGPGGQLRRISASGLKATILDERGGAIWRAVDGRLEGTRRNAAISLSASANFTGPRGPAPASVAITTNAAFDSALVELIARDVRLNALVPPQVLGPLEKVRAPVTAAITVGVDRKQGVTRIEGDVTLGAGEVELAGGKLALSGAAVSGRYDLATDILVIDDVQLAGARTQVQGELRFRNASSFLGANDQRISQFDLALSRLELDMPGFLGAPTALTDVKASGRLLISENAIEVADAVAYLDGQPARATGRFGLADDGAGVIRPSIKLDATLPGDADIRKIIAFWPIPLDPPVRTWADTNILSGRIQNARAILDLRPADLRGAGIPRERIDVTFDFTDAVVRYIDQMTPVERGAGSAKVEGDRFDLTLNAASLKGLAVSKGRIFLPSPAVRLRDPAVYRLTAAGELKTVVDVLLEAPLGVAAALPFDPATLTGAGTVTVDVRGLRQRLQSDAETISFDVDGRFEGVGGAFKGVNARLSEGRVSVSGDERALTFSGPAALGASRAEVVWTEALRQGAVPRSRFAIAGLFDARELDALGFGVGNVMSGPIGVEVRGAGEGMAFNTAGVRLDLRRAGLRLPGDVWVKPAGVEASLAFEARRGGDGGVSIRDLDLRGEGGVYAAGAADFTPDNRLRSARIGRFAIGADTNASVNADRDANGVLQVKIAGPSFSLAPWLGAKPATTTPTPSAAPTTTAPGESVMVAMDVDKIVLLGNAALHKASLRAQTQGASLAAFSLAGAPDGDGAMTVSLGDGEGPGPLQFDTTDAGFAVRAFTGADNVRGGRAQAAGIWRPGAKTQAEFTVTANDFKVVRMGALAELLSSVSSLTGLVDSLNGEGIAFKGLEAPIVIDDSKLTLRDARASGDSLGITAKGSADLDKGQLALDGVVAPAYGLNGLLNEVPVLGAILTSRPGEGVVGITYTIAGKADAPRVGVNPLSALAPGFLRRIFEPVTPREDRPRPRSRREQRAG